MYEDYNLAGRGLKTLFAGRIIALVAVFLVWIPLVGLLAVLAGFILGLVGLHTASPAHPMYKTAFMVTVATTIVNLLSGLLGGESALGEILSVVITVLNFLSVYYVCTATGHLLSAKGDQATADLGANVWKLNAICGVVAVVCSVLLLVPIINIVAGLSLVVTVVASIVASILYLVFLNRASKSLLS